MKRIMTLLLAVAVLLLSSPFACGESTPRTGADLSYARVVEMAEYMRELATGDYLDIKQVPDEMQAIAEGWAAGITGQPRLVVQLDINHSSYLVETRALFTQEPPIVLFEAESSAVVEVWQYMAISAGYEAGVTESGYEEIMKVNGHINAGMMYAEDGTEGNAMYIVLYENAAPILYIVSAENGAVSIRGMFLPSAKLAKCKNYGQVAMWLMLNGLSMTCQEIKPE